MISALKSLKNEQGSQAVQVANTTRALKHNNRKRGDHLWFESTDAQGIRILPLSQRSWYCERIQFLVLRLASVLLLKCSQLLNFTVLNVSNGTSEHEPVVIVSISNPFSYCGP